jgi:iron(III) transport system permease protein
VIDGFGTLRRARAWFAENSLLLLATIWIVMIVGIPLSVTVIGSLRGPAEVLPFNAEAYWSLGNYQKVLSDPALLRSLADTAIYAMGSVAIAAVFGAGLGWLVGRTNLPFRHAIFVVMLFPLLLPPVLVVIAWILLLHGPFLQLNELVRSVVPGFPILQPYSMAGMIFVQGLSYTGLAFLLTVSAVLNQDPSLEEASAMSGAGPVTTTLRITLPLLRPAILSMVILITIFTIEGYEVPLLLGISSDVSVLSREVYLRLNRGDEVPLWGELMTFAVFYLAIVYLCFIAYARLTWRAQRFATVGGKGFRPRTIDLGVWRWIMLLPVGFVVGIVIVFPTLILVWTSFHGTYVPFDAEGIRSLTLGSYEGLFNERMLWPAIWKTLLVAGGSATIVASIGALTAWTVVRSRSRLRVVADLLASSSLGVPSVLAGVAFLIAYLSVPNPLYGTVWLLILAFSYRLALSYRLQRATVIQLGRELEEASLVSGASPLQTFGRIILPLLAPSALIVWLLIFVAGAREFTIPLTLGEKEMLGPMLYFMTDRLGRAAALGTLTMVVVAVGSFIAYRFGLRAVRRF